MYNPKYIQALNVVPATQGGQYTSFTDLDTNKVVELLIEPSERSYSYQAEYSKLQVKGTKSPLLAYMQSEVNISLPSVLFWTYGNQRDLAPILQAIAAFTIPVAETGEPPVLKLTIGSEVWERVRVSKFSYRTKMAREGHVLMAEGSMEVLIDPTPPEQTEFVQEKPVPPKLSLPEQAQNATKVKELLEKDVVKAKKYNYLKGKSKVEVDEAGKVKIDDKDVGYLKDILGADTPPGLNTPSLTKEGKKGEGVDTSGM